MSPEITKDEFCARFKAEMLRVVAPRTHFDDDEDGPGGSIAEYAAETGPTYFDEPDQRAEGPEQCARDDISYWEN